MTTPMLDTGVDTSIVRSPLFAPFDVTMLGELSWISRSERCRQRITTCMFFSTSSAETNLWLFGSVADVDGAGSFGRVSPSRRVLEADLDTTDRDLGRTETGLLTRAREEAGRRVAMLAEVARKKAATSQLAIGPRGVVFRQQTAFESRANGKSSLTSTMGKRKKSSRKPAPARQKVPLGTVATFHT